MLNHSRSADCELLWASEEITKINFIVIIFVRLSLLFQLLAPTKTDTFFRVHYGHILGVTHNTRDIERDEKNLTVRQATVNVCVNVTDW